MLALTLRCMTLAAAMLTGAALAGPTRVVDPGNPGPDLPPQGRSLFDQLTIVEGEQRIPYPFDALVALVESRLDKKGAYLGRPVKQVLIPLGRSLQRNAAAPDFFDSPRVVAAVDSEPAAHGQSGGMLLRDRLFIAYLEAAKVLEVISYNERAARFEFQVVSDYGPGSSPDVRYARRIVCIACHQNAAPLFARPLWDETNANQHVAERLADTGKDFYGVPTRQGVDIAYAIDNATDRANALALTQLLWSEGCGAGDAGAACRASMLLAALQHGLSGQRGYANVGDAGQQLQRQQQRLWPDGLLLPVSDIPNRRPLAAAVTDVGAANAKPLRYLADIDGAFEPLNPRDEDVVWRPVPERLVDRTVTGLQAFFSTQDFLQLDRYLRDLPVPQSTITADCRTGDADFAGSGPVSLQCKGSSLSASGILYRQDTASPWRGRLRSVRVHGADLGSLQLDGASISAPLTFHAVRSDWPLAVRLPDADAIAGVQVRFSESPRPGATLSVQIRHESQPLAEHVAGTLDAGSGRFGRGPFVRRTMLPALSPMLAGDICCDPPTTPLPLGPDLQADLPPDASLDPFVQVCGSCHRSSEPFPPNFLAGSAAQIRKGLAQCAERIQFRLAMWDLPPEQRPKSPMPPHYAAHIDTREISTWMNGLLRELRAALRKIVEQQGYALPSDAVMRLRRYADLRSCIATS